MNAEIPRLASDIPANNLILIGTGLAASLLALWIVRYVLVFFIDRSARASRLKTLETAASTIRTRFNAVVRLISLLLVILAVAGAGYSLWQSIDLHVHLQAAVDRFDHSLWIDLGWGAIVLIFLFVAFSTLRRITHASMPRIKTWLEIDSRGAEYTERFDKLFTHLPATLDLVLAYLVLGWAIAAANLPDTLAWLIETTIYILLVISASRTLALLSYLIIERVTLAWEARTTEGPFAEYFAALHRIMPVAHRSIEAIIYISAVTLIVGRFEALESVAPYGPILVRAISMFFIARVAAELSHLLIARVLQPTGDSEDERFKRKRSFTVLLQKMVTYVIYFCVAVMLLDSVGIDPAPILAGAGIVGLTVGLGSQKIVQDLICGLFLLFEDQLLLGDYVRIGDTEGMVEEIHLRITRVRDRFGRLHTIRNGDIQNVINYSRGWTLAVVEMSVAYESNLGQALEVIAKSTARLPELMPDSVEETPKVMGIEAIAESCLLVRIEAKVKPGQHYEAKRIIHRLLVDSFNEHGLEIPYPKAVEIGIEG